MDLANVEDSDSPKSVSAVFSVVADTKGNSSSSDMVALSGSPWFSVMLSLVCVEVTGTATE